MTDARSFIWCSLVFICLLTLGILTPPLEAQISVDGKVMGSKNQPVGGVDVAIYIPGNKTAIASQTSDYKTGEYHFAKLQLNSAFDIVYTHSKYELATVSRLANNDNQHVSKVVYLKGEPMPLTALQERFLSNRRLVFLATAIDSADDRAAFVRHFSDLKIWDGLDRDVDKMTDEKLSGGMRKLLQTEQSQTLSLR